MKKDSLHEHIKKFNKMIQVLPDQSENTYEFINFIRVLFRIQTTEKKPIAVITVIKHEKPNIFYEIKKYARNDQALGFAVELEMDYELAKEILKM